MPFSSDGDTIDFIYGVINWKHGVAADAQAPAAPEAASVAEMPVVEFAQPEHDEEEIAAELQPDPIAEEEEPLELTEIVEASTLADVFTPALEIVETEEEQPEAPVHFSWEDGPLQDEDDVPAVELDENAGLADRLWAARETAESVKAGEGRTRSALYKALSLAYDFAVAAQQNPEEYAELLEESGVKAQARAPMTPIVKLVFGIDYDKARLTEFAAALSFAQRQAIALGAFQDFIEKQPGGLKALVAAERQARRPEAKPDTKGEVARTRLRSAPAISLADVSAAEEFAVVVTRRGIDGSHEAVAIVDDEALVERVIRRIA
jgi:hypothetical protein